MCSIPQRGAKRKRTHSEAARWQGAAKIKPPLRVAYFGGPEGISPARGDKLRLPQAHGKNKSTLAGGLFLVDLQGFEPSTSRMRTERSAAWRTFSRRNYSRTKSKKAYKNMTTAKNGVYSWAEKALPSCKRRAEVLSSCDDIKIMWRSTGAYRVRYVTRPAFPV